MSLSKNVCRLCMGNSNVIHTVFENNLLQKIAICVSLLISPDDKTFPLGVCALCALKVKDFFEFRQNCLKVQQILEQNLDKSCESGDSETLIPVIKSEPPIREKEEHVLNKFEIDVDDGENEKQIDEEELSKEETEEQLDELLVIDDLEQSIEQLEEAQEDIDEVLIESESEMHLDIDSSQSSNYDIQQALEKAKQKQVYAVEMVELLSYNEEDDTDQKNISSSRASRSSLESFTDSLCSSPLIRNKFDSARRRTRNKSRLPDAKPYRDEKEIYRSLLMTCEICGKSVERNRMEGHHNQHLNIRPYTCNADGCEATFHSKIALRLHTKGRHGTEQLPCDLCGKIYTSKKALYHHKKETHAEKQFECEQCGLVFVSNSRLNRHKITHSDQREFKCPHCPKEFYRRNNLKVHLRSHTKEKPFACNSCDKAFGYQRLLKDHISRQHKNVSC